MITPEKGAVIDASFRRARAPLSVQRTVGAAYFFLLEAELRFIMEFFRDGGVGFAPEIFHPLGFELRLFIEDVGVAVERLLPFDIELKERWYLILQALAPAWTACPSLHKTSSTLPLTWAPTLQLACGFKVPQIGILWTSSAYPVQNKAEVKRDRIDIYS